MTESDRATFLRQAYHNNWQRYLISLRADARTGWDVCVLTASDERQAASYRHQLRWRRQGELLPVRTCFLVLPDPGGQRIGSGGATLRVLHELRQAGSPFHPGCEATEPLVRRRTLRPLGFQVGEELPDTENALASLRILILHSGGDSRRLPHCSALGKLFARVPRVLPDGRASTIFDEFLISLSGLANELPPGVLVASGDVLLVYDHLQLSFQRPGVIGVAADVSAEVGTHHGVYVPDDRGRLRAYLHKPSLNELTRWDAIDDKGAVPIDTGLAWFDAATAEELVNLTQEGPVAALCGLSDAAPPEPQGGLNLYGDLLLPLAASTTFAGYMADSSDGLATSQVRGARQVIWDRLRGTSFTVQRLRPAVFVHIGTSYEYWQVTAADQELAQICGWTPRAAAWLDASSGSVDDPVRSAGECLVLVNAALEGPVRPGCKPALVTDSHLSGALSWQGATILAGVHTTRSLALERDIVLHQLPVDGGFVSRIYGLYDDPKRIWDDPSATFMNCPWADWLAEAGVAPELLWPDLPSVEWMLWNARLYPLVPDREESLRLALPLQFPARAVDGWRAQWERAHRLSLAESFQQGGMDLILEDSVAIEDRVVVQRACAAIEAEQPAAEIGALLGSAAETRARRSEHLCAWLSEADPLLCLRGYKALAEATGDAAWEDRAFVMLAELIEATLDEQRSALREQQAQMRHQQLASHPRLSENRSVRIEAAARVDFGGGWTDTPPYSIERGGEVLNAALTLRGAYPILAEAAWLPEPRLVLECRDIDTTLEPTLLGEVLSCANPADPFCLHKAALVLRGLVPVDGDPDTPLSDVLRPRGGGLRLTTGTSIPRGSGLGTSSILAGAVLACLGQMLGIAIPQSTLFDEVLCLEQMMTTGGGWQDQVGGLVGGIKLVTSEPGLPQVIQVNPVCLSAEAESELAQRLVLVYTGQRRLAKNLLRIVVGRWLGRDPEMVWLLREIARLAQEMRDALQAGDIGSFGELLGEHWALNKRIDPGCTNPFIDDLFAGMEPYICGGKLAGAGGGGFAIVVTRGTGGEQEMDRILRARYPNTPVAVWPCAIPAQAMVRA